MCTANSKENNADNGALSHDPKARSNFGGVLEEFKSLCEDMHYVFMKAEKAHSMCYQSHRALSKGN